MTTSEKEAKRQGLIELYSDFHKDAYGFRPRYDYPSFSLEDLEADYERFESLCESNHREEEEANERAIASFEARVQSVIDIGAGDRETALRWIADSYDEYDFGYGAEFFVTYELGLGVNERSKAIAAEFEPVLYGVAA